MERMRGCRGSFPCLCFSSWDETTRLICVGGGGNINAAQQV